MGYSKKLVFSWVKFSIFADFKFLLILFSFSSVLYSFLILPL